MRAIVTRPAEQAATWVAELRALGVDADALPLIGIAPLADAALVHAAWATLHRRSLVMFVSANAVGHFFAVRPEGADWPVVLPAASTGPGTSAALRAAGVAVIVEPGADALQFDSEALWAQLRQQSWQGRSVLVVRGEDGRDWFGQTLTAHGAQVDYLAAYRRVPPGPDAAGRALLAAALAQPAGHCWVFSSSEAVAHLQQLAPAVSWAGSFAVASHPRIAETVRRAGFGRVEQVPPDPTALAALLRGT